MYHVVYRVHYEAAAFSGVWSQHKQYLVCMSFVGVLWLAAQPLAAEVRTDYKKRNENLKCTPMRDNYRTHVCRMHTDYWSTIVSADRHRLIVWHV